MMIKSLTLENYKSFKNRVDILFNSKNIILGKNGTGKSNLISALATLFLIKQENTNTRYNYNDDNSYIRMELCNKDRRLPYNSDIVTVQINLDTTISYYINSKSVTKEELSGIYENGGLNSHCFVFQGFKVIEDIYKLISTVAGAEKYEDSKTQAIKNLDDSDISYMIEKLEYKNTKYFNFTKQLESFMRLEDRRKEVNYQLTLLEISELTDKLLQISKDHPTTMTEDYKKTTELLELELMEVRSKIIRNKKIIEQQEVKLKNVDEGTLNVIKNSTGENVYLEKVKELEKVKAEESKKMDEIKAEEKDIKILIKGTQLFTSYLETITKFTNSQNQKEFKMTDEDRQKELEIVKSCLEKKIEEITNKDLRKQNLGKLISRQKELWVEKSKIAEESFECKKKKTIFENKLLHIGNQAINMADSIKDYKGVLGTVFSMIDVPVKFEVAFEAVAKSSLFYVVVENEEIGLNCIREFSNLGRITFIPLNRIREHKNRLINIPGNSLYINKLSDLVCINKDNDSIKELIDEGNKLVKFITKDFYVCDTLKKAMLLNEKYRVNTVTLDGDIVYADSTISGGYEASSSILREFKANERKIGESKVKLDQIEVELEKLKKEVSLYCQITEEDEGEDFNVHGVVKYLELKKIYLKTGEVKVDNIPGLEKKLSALGRIKHSLMSKITEITKSILDRKMKSMKYQMIAERVKSQGVLKVEISDLMQKETNLMKVCLEKENLTDGLKNATGIWGEDTSVEKSLLLSKRDELMKKIGLKEIPLQFKNEKDSLIGDKHKIMKGHHHLPSTTKEELLIKLKSIIKELKPYEVFSNNNALNNCNSHKSLERLFNVNEVKEELMKLKSSKKEILEYINHLDSEKCDKINLTFSMVSDAYSYFYEHITGKKSILVKDCDSVNIEMDGKIISDINELSSGQKTVISISVILALQKVDPSPFYVFDEIDANLDVESAAKVYELVKVSDAQFFITTFKKEGVMAGNKYIGIALEDKISMAGEIDINLALDTLKVSN